jgi:membrane-associated PAP2 superfamily phosphatase
MNRTGLLIALAVAAGVGIVFGLYPNLDLALSQALFDRLNPGFARAGPLIGLVRDGSMWLVALIAAPAFVAPVVKLLLPRRPLLRRARAALFLIATLLLAPGLTTNIVLKDYWGRPRPEAIVQFGGSEQFLPWWDPRGPCRNNCSFVAGEPSGAFWTMAAATLAPAPWRPLAYGAAVTFGLGVGLMRMTFGGHFFTDVVFAGVLTFLIIWLVHGAIYRWRRTRLSDAMLEHALERIATPVYDFVVGLWRGKRRA